MGQLKKGKSVLIQLSVSLTGLILVNALSINWLLWPSFGTLFGQFIFVALTLVLIILTWKGFRTRWFLFTWYLICAFQFFFVGGQRMAFQHIDQGLSAMLSVLAGLIMIGSAIVLGGNEHIHTYLNSIQRPSADEMD